MVIASPGRPARASDPARGAAPRARACALVLTDCDGVLTDGAVYYSARRARR